MFFFFKQKTAYEMRISDWSSDVCSSDLISREYGMPLRFPGGAERIGEATDARLIAKAIEWAATSPNAHNQVFNITTGDVYAWQNIWPRVAELSGMEHAPDHQFSLSRALPQHAPIWARIAPTPPLHPHP